MGNMPAVNIQGGTPRSFLDEVYRSLGYDEGSLVEAIDLPESEMNQDWLEKGDWLALAHKVGAEKVFFVNNDPVMIFCALQHKGDDEQPLLEKFRRVWCMSRPRFLFIAWPGELRLYRLDRVPTRDTRILKEEQQIAIVKNIAEVLEKLYAYRRENIESGKIYEDERFGDINQRADKRLIQDLKTVRKLLLTTGLKPRHAHALIGRSIFVRYLEDREVIDHKYFEKIAQGQPGWMEILSHEPERPDLAPGNEKRRYYRVLLNKDFTYALFKKLAQDFNGDMFPEDKEEEESISEKHLQLLHDFLLGEVNAEQPHLFLWAYDFELIPIELISSIYEEFYHKENSFNNKQGNKRQDDIKTHYTPSILVEYILSNLLSSERLATNPVILDPACGSGIFLVESFRRIVRYKMLQRGRKRLSYDELRQILKEQIKGIEINEEATHVAAFSLYLALLHYQEPPDIRTKRLPKLIYREGQVEDEDHYHVLFNKNTFALLREEKGQISAALTMMPLRSGERRELEKLSRSQDVLPFDPHSFDIITGNPPWGFERGGTADIREAQQQARRWCWYFDWSIGDNEPSQMFIARCLSLLKHNGDCGLLVPTGVFLKHQENSKKFRQRWLEEASIWTIVNFAHVRHAFFNMDANAPFVFVQFSSEPATSEHWINYWSVKKTELVDKTQAIILGQPDIRRVKQIDLAYNDFLWKVYWWGNHHDATLIKALKLNTTLAMLVETRGWFPPGPGFKDPSSNPRENKPSNWLKAYKALPTHAFKRYGAIDPADLEPIPEYVHRLGGEHIQEGWRLLMGQGITQAHHANGRVEARLEHESYSFRSSIFGVNVTDAEDWERKILIGIAWSSLARYYYFMTASSWGTWHHQIHLEEAMSLPVRFPSDVDIRNEITGLVDILLNWPAMNEEGSIKTSLDLNLLEEKLDKAIFKLYRLNDAESDLILDLCEFNLEFFYRHTKSRAAESVGKYPRLSQGLIGNLSGERKQERGFEGYLYAFLERWNKEIAPEGEFRWTIIRPANIPMVAVVFTTQEVGDPLPVIDSHDDEEWYNVLKRCSAAARYPISRRIYIDSMIRVVTETEIYIIKRDERRLWTRSMAREDAEATFVQAMFLQEEAMKEITSGD